MGKTNAQMVRFKIEIENVPVADVINVDGHNLGEEGAIDVPEWDRDVQIANGKRKITEITMKYRLMRGLLTHRYFFDWWKNRNGDNRNIVSIWYDRGWNEMFRWIYYDCEFAKFSADGQDLGQTKLGIIDLKFYPYDIDMIIA